MARVFQPNVFQNNVFQVGDVSRQKDGDPDYWKLPWFNIEGIEGGTFAERLRAKAITALEKAADAAEKAEAPKAKRAVRKAAKELKAYAAGALLSDDAITELGQIAKQLNYTASQWDREEFMARVSEAHMALLAYEAAQQDDEEALIALMVS